ncbi:MAG TPA: lytic transglycosylase domain-containing protein, partial [Solirubrobacteraceae bacterium]|jgi:soluble lytic murein transglycosylase|nr:lytic transglycosylase domain-containing protein [Solirubrobacteraceae bacterium]
VSAKRGVGWMGLWRSDLVVPAKGGQGLRGGRSAVAAPRARGGHRSSRQLHPARALVRALLAFAVLAGLCFAVVARVEHASQDAELPLSDAGVIREQAAEKHLDPTLIAAVIYTETKFDPRTSSAGALGLMQILPSTAHYIAHLSGGTTFTTGDLATPRINVAYGSWYLRYLLEHYEGNEMLAVAAYNGGLANVDAWVAKARAAGRTLGVSEIPFPETQAYVQKVLRAQAEYRAVYSRQLGL